jgi:hypothetical protein
VALAEVWSTTPEEVGDDREVTRLVDAVVATLGVDLVELDRARLEALARAELDRYRGAAVTQYIPLLVERAVRLHLRAAATTGGTTP